MTLELFLLYSNAIGIVLVLIGVAAIYSVIKGIKPDVRYVTRKNGALTVESIKDVYQEAWDGEVINPNKRMETVKK